MTHNAPKRRVVVVVSSSWRASRISKENHEPDMATVSVEIEDMETETDEYDDSLRRFKRKKWNRSKERRRGRTSGESD